MADNSYSQEALGIRYLGRGLGVAKNAWNDCERGLGCVTVKSQYSGGTLAWKGGQLSEMLQPHLARGDQRQERMSSRLQLTMTS